MIESKEPFDLLVGSAAEVGPKLLRLVQLANGNWLIPYVRYLSSYYAYRLEAVCDPSA